MVYARRMVASRVSVIVLFCLLSASGLFAGPPERVWVGPEYWANRLQDWRVREGRMECIEARASFPLRTVFDLQSTIRAKGTGALVRVRLGQIRPAEAERFLVHRAGMVQT